MTFKLRGSGRGDRDGSEAARAEELTRAAVLLEQRSRELEAAEEELKEVTRRVRVREPETERLRAKIAEQADTIDALQRVLGLALVRMPDLLDDLSGLDDRCLRALRSCQLSRPEGPGNSAVTRALVAALGEDKFHNLRSRWPHVKGDATHVAWENTSTTIAGSPCSSSSGSAAAPAHDGRGHATPPRRAPLQTWQQQAFTAGPVRHAAEVPAPAPAPQRAPAQLPQEPRRFDQMPTSYGSAPAQLRLAAQAFTPPRSPGPEVRWLPRQVQSPPATPPPPAPAMATGGLQRGRSAPMLRPPSACVSLRCRSREVTRTSTPPTPPAAFAASSACSRPSAAVAAAGPAPAPRKHAPVLRVAMPPVPSVSAVAAPKRASDVRAAFGPEPAAQVPPTPPWQACCGPPQEPAPRARPASNGRGCSDRARARAAPAAVPAPQYGSPPGAAQAEASRAAGSSTMNAAAASVAASAAVVAAAARATVASASSVLRPGADGGAGAEDGAREASPSREVFSGARLRRPRGSWPEAP